MVIPLIIMSVSKQHIFYLLAIVIFMVPMFVSLLTLDGVILGITGNQAAFLFCGLFGILFFLRLILFYARYFRLLDFFLILFVFFYFMGRGEINLETVSNILRLIICFYVVPYFFSYYRSLRQDEKVFGLYVVCLFLLIVLSLFFGEFRSNRFVSGAHANVTSQNFLALWIVLFLAYGLTRDPVKTLVLLFVHVLVTGIIILTLSRQAFLGMVIFILLYFYQDYFKSLTLNKLAIGFFSVVFLSLIMLFSLVYLDGFERIWSLESYSGFFKDSRFVLWVHYSSYIAGNVTDLLFSGFDSAILKDVYSQSTYFRFNAPHNFVIQFVALSGVVSTLFFVLVLFGCIRDGINLFRRRYHFSMAVFAVVLALAFVDNFFTETSRNVSYLFWITAGMSANYLRLNIHLHHSGKGHY